MKFEKTTNAKKPQMRINENAKKSKMRKTMRCEK